MQGFQLLQPFDGERTAGGQRFVSTFTAHPLHNIRRLLKVKRHLYDFRPAAGLLFRQFILGDARQIELDSGIEHVDIICQPA